MNKKTIGIISIILFLIGIYIFKINKNYQEKQVKQITGTIIYKNNNKMQIQDNNNIIYTFSNQKESINVGENVILKYVGLLDKNTEIQNAKVLELIVAGSSDYPLNPDDIFGHFYDKARNRIKNLSLEEKISELILAKYPDNALEVLNNYNLGGFVFYEKDFKDKTESEVINMTKKLQNKAKIPLLTAVDEEGGNVVRVSSNPNLVSEKFKSPSELYNDGGLSLIRQDTITKSYILNKLGLNLNLAPVVDVSTDSASYIYNRTLKQNVNTTAKYAETVVLSSKNTNVSYTLKHFPGYGNNTDTHVAGSIDTRSYDDILNNDVIPFKSGIDAGAEAIMMSHNIVTSIDGTNPVSLSPSAHNLLRNNLNFSGIIIADDLDMAALDSISDKNVKAILAGNDLIISTNYENAVNEIKTAVVNQTISESLIDRAATRVIAWKYYKGLIVDSEK